MGRDRRLGAGRENWLYLFVGILVMAVLAAPGLGPFAPARWPLTGAFGAFTWIAWLASGVFGVALGMAGATTRGRARVLAWRGSLGFFFLAAVSQGAAVAAAVGLIQSRPLASLLVALGSLWVSRKLLPA